MLQTVKNFFSSLWDFVTSFFDWLRDVLLWVTRKLFADGVTAFVDFISSIDPPSWMTNMGSLWGSIPSGIWWFASVGEFGYGLTVVGGALLIRFTLRAVPFFF